MFFAAPHNAEKIIKTTIEAYSIGLRPVISDTRPLMGVNIVWASKYDWVSEFSA